MNRSAGRFNQLVDQLTERDQLILRALSQHRLLDGKQLRRLFFCKGEKEASNARLTRLKLAKLERLGLAMRLARRVGGVRAGSTGTIWQLTPDGQRLLAYLDGAGLGRPRAASEPGAAYVAHTLAASEIYVKLREAEQHGQLELLDYQDEPACWRQFSGDLVQLLTLKPDGFVAIGVGAFEERAFIEVDLASHGRVALKRKLRLYANYQRSGNEQRASGVFPRVIWTTPTAARVQQLARLVAELPPDVAAVHQAVTMDGFIGALTRHELDELMQGGER